MVIAVSAEQSANAETEIVSRLSGRLTEVSAEHLPKVFLPSVLSPCASVTLDSGLRFEA